MLAATVASPADAGGLNTGMCAHQSERVDVPDDFVIEVCFDGETIYFRNDSSVLIRVTSRDATRGAIRSGITSIASAIVSATADAEVLASDVQLSVPVTEAGATFTIVGEPGLSQVHALALTIEQFVPIDAIGHAGALADYINEVITVTEDLQVCLAGSNFLTDGGCWLGWDWDMKIAVGRLAVKTGITLVGGVTGTIKALLDTSGHMSDGVDEVGNFVHGSKTLTIAGLDESVDKSDPPVAPDDPATGAVITRFSSPSGNIVCGFASVDGDDSVSCSIDRKNWEVNQQHIPDGGTCDLDYGHEVFLYNGATPAFSCVSDVPWYYLDDAGQVTTPMVLPYGQSVTYGPFTCRSETTGLSCWETQLGSSSGFVMARNTYPISHVDETTATRDLLGTWSGPVDQPGVDRYTMVMEVQEFDGQIVGRVDYPELSCGGTMTQLSVKGNNHVEMHETIEYGLSRCVDNGTVAIELNPDETLDWTWTRPGLLTNAQLTRTSD